MTLTAIEIKLAEISRQATATDEVAEDLKAQTEADKQRAVRLKRRSNDIRRRLRHST
jgi:hypothetical protein